MSAVPAGQLSRIRALADLAPALARRYLASGDAAFLGLALAAARVELTVPGAAATSSAPGHVTIARVAGQARALTTTFGTLATVALTPGDSARLITQLARAAHR